MNKPGIFNLYVLRHGPAKAALLLAFTLGGAAQPPGTALAQQPVAGETPAPAEQRLTVPALPSDDQYRIGPGDVLDIRVISRPQLSREAVRVDQRGTIIMPWIDREIPAVCRTERELAGEITSLYRRYQRNPQVDVFVKEYQSKPVAVIGAVNSPGRFQLQRRVRLLELLALVNGPTDRAGRSLQIVHSDDAPPCAPLATDEEIVEVAGTDLSPREVPADEEERVTTLNLEDVMRSAGDANPYLEPGDVVTVLEAGQIFVVGNVLKPSPFPLKGALTVSQAVAMAGGLAPDAKAERVRIVRQTPGGKEELYANLKDIDKRKAEDIALQANDIVDVPSSLTGGKKVVQRILNSFFPSVGSLPFRVIR